MGQLFNDNSRKPKTVYNNDKSQIFSFKFELNLPIAMLVPVTQTVTSLTFCDDGATSPSQYVRTSLQQMRG